MSKKTKLIATLMAMCLVISLGVIGILAVRTLNMKIGGNITFNAEGIAFSVGEGKFYEDDATTIYTGISSQTGKMQGFSMDTDTKLTDVSEAIATWTDLELGLDNRGDAILKFNVSNDMSDKKLYVVFDIAHGENTNDNMVITTQLLQEIPAGDDIDIEIKFDILDMDLNAGLEGFEISVTFADKVQANNSGTVTNNTTTALTNVKYSVTDATKKEVSATPVADDITGNVIIPETVYINDEPYTVTSISEGAFASLDITGVYIPGTVKSIGEFAFDSCSELMTVQLAYGIQRIETCAFLDFSMISGELVIPDSVTYIGGSAFNNDCTEARFILTISKNITTIENNAFSGPGVANEELIIPNSVTSIGDHAFAGISSKKVVIPKSVTSIGKGIFSYCRNLETIIVEQGNTKYHVAGNCLIETTSKRLKQGLKNSVIPTDGSVTIIGSAAFESIYGLKSIIIPASVTTIESDSISWCRDLSKIVIEATRQPNISLGEYEDAPFDECNDCLIYVPAASVNAYKTANVWKLVADRIVAM